LRDPAAGRLHIGEYADPDHRSSGQANQPASRRRQLNNRARSTTHSRRRARHDHWRVASNDRSEDDTQRSRIELR
jgi:hypothetical protein